MYQMTPNKSKNQRELNPFPSVSLNIKKLNEILSSHPTPLFVSDRTIINRQFNDIDQALNQHWGENHAVAYSLKTKVMGIQNCTNVLLKFAD